MVSRVRWIEGGVRCEQTQNRKAYFIRRNVSAIRTGSFLSVNALRPRGTREEMLLLAHAIRTGGEYVGGTNCAVRMIRFGALLWDWGCDRDCHAGVWYQDALALADQIFRDLGVRSVNGVGRVK